MGENKFGQTIVGIILTFSFMFMFIAGNTGGSTLVGADGHTIVFQQTTNQKIPTYEEVKTFIAMDNTNHHAYQPGVFECGDYAEQVQHNAAQMGYPCGICVIDFTTGPAHAVNVFKTSDKGNVYFDCTCYDSAVTTLEPGQTYQPIALDGGIIKPLGIIKSIEEYWN